VGVDIILNRVEQKGTSPKNRQLVPLDVVVDQGNVFAEVCAAASSPMLRSVDPYRTRKLTVQDMDQFIAAIESVIGDAEEPQRKILSRILEVAQRCSTDDSLELWLEGD
jgi:hypothetical protein